jgi:hypothetical protein
MCWWIFGHKWGKWEDTEIWYSDDMFTPKPILVSGQFRYCERCNKKKVRMN